MMILSTLEQYFGFNQFREGQQAVIEKVVNGQSAAAIFPTGSGKSLCYQLSALHLPHLTLVISPLLALIKDQLDFLASKNIAAANIDSSQTPEQSQQVMAGIRQGQIKILLISVERLKNERFRRFISQVPISLLVVDEAHCISEWGHNFRPDYLKLPQYRQEFNIPQTLLLTATATPEVIKDMEQKFAIPADNIIVTGFYRPNLNLAVEPVTAQTKDQALLHWLNQAPNQPTIVYVTLQHTAETVASYLNRHNIQASAYHAGMDHQLRQQTQLDFMQGQVNYIVATIAFGMGIDKRDIRQVIHYDLPKSIENYSQEIGRAGRDGQTSQCVVLANVDNLNVLENFVYGDTPELEGIINVLENIKTTSAAAQWETMTYPLSNQSNIRQLPLKTLLVYLQLQKIIEPRYSYFGEYRFKLNISEQQLLEHFSGERQSFVQALLQSSKKAKTWASMDFDKLYQQYGGDRERAITALEYCNDKNYIQLESKQMTDVYQLLRSDFEINATAQQLHQQFTDKEHSEITRINNMVSFFQSNSCLSQKLARYFGDEQLNQPCGHCGVCNGFVATLPPPPKLKPLSQYPLNDLCQELIAAHPGQPSSHLLTRFLCGITTPIFTKLKARKMSGFAKLENYRYAEVKRWIEQH